MKRLITLFGLLALAFSAFGETVSWTMPTERVDGTPMTAEEIAGTEVCVTEPSAECLDGSYVPAPATTYDVDLGYGEFSIRARTVDVEGRQSAWTDPVLVKNVAPPNSPAGLSVR